MCPVIGDGIKNTLTTVFLLLLATAESCQDFADHSVTFFKSNSFEARNII